MDTLIVGIQVRTRSVGDGVEAIRRAYSQLSRLMRSVPSSRTDRPDDNLVETLCAGKLPTTEITETANSPVNMCVHSGYS